MPHTYRNGLSIASLTLPLNSPTNHLARILTTGDPLELFIRKATHSPHNDLQRGAGVLCLKSVTPAELTRPAPFEYPRGRLPLPVIGSRSDATEQRGHRSSLRRFDLFGELGIIHPLVKRGATDASRGRGQRDRQPRFEQINEMLTLFWCLHSVRL